MSRNVQLIIHAVLMLLGAIVANDILSDAGKAYEWPEAQVHLWTKIMMIMQGLGQTLAGTIAQGYNVDGSKPGNVVVETRTQIPGAPGEPKVQVTETETVSKKEA